MKKWTEMERFRAEHEPDRGGEVTNVHLLLIALFIFIAFVAIVSQLQAQDPDPDPDPACLCTSGQRGPNPISNNPAMSAAVSMVHQHNTAPWQGCGNMACELLKPGSPYHPANVLYQCTQEGAWGSAEDECVSRHTGNATATKDARVAMQLTALLTIYVQDLTVDAMVCESSYCIPTPTPGQCSVYPGVSNDCGIKLYPFHEYLP